MDQVLRMLSQVGNLKNLARAGWVRDGVPRPESVADHTFRTTVLALVLGPQLDVDTAKLIQLLLVHDLPESDPAVGDITPRDGVPPEEKHRREREAMQRLCAPLANGPALLALWQEYAAGQSPEAQIAKQLDALEMALQAAEYEEQHGRELAHFHTHARARIHHPVLVQLLDQLHAAGKRQGPAQE
jgi:5'-deoxynucleotidase YfbR-like HD superfamily hydrolase